MLEEHEILIEKYISFVQENLDKMKKHTAILAKSDVQLFDLKIINGQRLNVLFTLMSEYQRYKAHLRLLQEDYNIWWSTEYSITRTQLNPHSLPGNKYASKSEIEAETISRNKEKYKQLKHELFNVESKLEFLRRLLNDWRSIQFDIQNEIKILSLEASTFGFENSLNRQAQEIETNRRQRKEVINDD